jgi:antirestriction protein ArdC
LGTLVKTKQKRKGDTHTMKTEDTNRIVEKIVEALGKGEIPWRKPWRSVAAHNAISGSEYRGVNALVLNLASHYPDPRFLTYKQAAALGAQVKKGEKGWPVIFYSTIKKGGESEGGESTGSEKAKTFRFMKHYTVFNASQCDGMPEREAAAAPVAQIVEADEIIKRMPRAPKIVDGSRACYIPSQDIVNMPPKTAHWTSASAYYDTMFHELTHSTGHESRLERDLGGNFGSEKYAKEELVAEIGAQFLCQSSGINRAEVEENAVAYCQNWSKVLKNDPKMIFYAAAKAQAAHDYIMGKEKS